MWLKVLFWKSLLFKVYKFNPLILCKILWHKFPRGPIRNGSKWGVRSVLWLHLLSNNFVQKNVTIHFNLGIGLDVFLNSIHCHIISGKSLQILVFLFNLWNPVSKCSQMKCWKCQKLKLSRRSWFKESFQLQRCLFFRNTMSVINHWGIDGVLRNWVFGKNCRILGYMTFFKTTHFPKIREKIWWQRECCKRIWWG